MDVFGALFTVIWAPFWGAIPGFLFRARVPRSIGLLSASAAAPAAMYLNEFHSEDLPAFRRLCETIPRGSHFLMIPLSAGFFAGHSLRCGGTLAGYLLNRSIGYRPK